MPSHGKTIVASNSNYQPPTGPPNEYQMRFFNNDYYSIPSDDAKALNSRDVIFKVAGFEKSRGNKSRKVPALVPSGNEEVLAAEGKPLGSEEAVTVETVASAESDSPTVGKGCSDIGEEHNARGSSTDNLALMIGVFPVWDDAYQVPRRAAFRHGDGDKLSTKRAFVDEIYPAPKALFRAMVALRKQGKYQYYAAVDPDSSGICSTIEINSKQVFFLPRYIGDGEGDKKVRMIKTGSNIKKRVKSLLGLDVDEEEHNPSSETGLPFHTKSKAQKEPVELLQQPDVEPTLPAITLSVGVDEMIKLFEPVAHSMQHLREREWQHKADYKFLEEELDGPVSRMLQFCDRLKVAKQRDGGSFDAETSEQAQDGSAEMNDDAEMRCGQEENEDLTMDG